MSGPRPASERASASGVDIGTFTMLPDQAAQWLGWSTEKMDDLVEKSRKNAARGIDGPLELIPGTPNITLTSLFAYRRRLTASTL